MPGRESDLESIWHTGTRTKKGHFGASVPIYACACLRNVNQWQLGIENKKLTYRICMDFVAGKRAEASPLDGDKAITSDFQAYDSQQRFNYEGRENQGSHGPKSGCSASISARFSISHAMTTKIVTGVEDEGGGRLRKNQGGESGSTASQSLRNGICFDRWDQLGWGVKHSRRWEGEFDSVSISWLSVLNQRMGFKDCLPGNFMDTTEIACPNHRRQPPEGCTRRKNCTRSIDCDEYDWRAVHDEQFNAAAVPKQSLRSGCHLINVLDWSILRFTTQAEGGLHLGTLDIVLTAQDLKVANGFRRSHTRMMFPSYQALPLRFFVKRFPLHEFYAAWSSIDGMSKELWLLERVGELQGFQGLFINVACFVFD
ncbi:hypothetical protein F5J12DRAFT_929938 [Pisolithus orientalis]|uniref:uncharacterized protein n=1 Tax=Pisolithus orientalis TaxID=936130 RepID=UPI00222468ED|nr:uncharacterized protein F5J12DRAFT_929938 [Pisolithus orientalis]KAI5989822.1 hypothetical protein F5J12DRAFT_929938 [Pisolithus orientalis]